MKTGTGNTKRLSSGMTTRTLAMVAACLILAGLYKNTAPDQFRSYLLILSAAVVPAVLWVRLGAPGIPIFPTVCLAYIPYFAWPIVSGNRTILAYDPSEVLQAACTVSLFLLAATLTWWLATRNSGKRAVSMASMDRVGVVRLILIGLFAGVVFHAGMIMGAAAWIGTYFGLVRSIVMTLAMVSFFLAGFARAQGFLRGKTWHAAAVGMALIIAMTLSSLFLVGGMLFGLAAAFGYFIVTRRIPWLSVAAVFAVIAVLHEGKGEMRAKYWTGSISGQTVSVIELPGFAAEWIANGLSGLASRATGGRSGGGDPGQSVLDRASLLHMLLRAERMTPSYIDYLKGETYALVPSVLAPRFIRPDKPNSQVALELLNVRYGIQTREAAALTTIGWGLLPEAFANFGYYGVLGMAVLLGLCCALLERWAAGAKLISIPMLAGIASMMVLINLEADFINIFLALIQSFVSVVIFSTIYRRLLIPRPRTEFA